MAISVLIMRPSGSDAEYHKIRSVTLVPGGFLDLVVSHYKTEDYRASDSPTVWEDIVRIPWPDWQTAFDESIAQVLYEVLKKAPSYGTAQDVLMDSWKDQNA